MNTLRAILCFFRGHDYTVIDDGELWGIAKCRCGAVRLVDSTERCSCTHDRYEHQTETPDGACAMLGCGCRSWDPT